MPLIGRCVVALALEDVAQVAAAVGTENLNPAHPVVLLVPRHGAGNAVKVSRPSAAGLELVRGLVQRRSATSAGVDASVWLMLVIFACAGGFCSLFPKDPELLCQMGKRVS